MVVGDVPIRPIRLNTFEVGYDGTTVATRTSVGRVYVNRTHDVRTQKA
jgi:hypothetical protein